MMYAEKVKFSTTGLTPAAVDYARATTPEKFDPYKYLDRVMAGGGEQIMLTDEFRATDIGIMLRTALRAIELLSERVRELEQREAAREKAAGWIAA